MNKNFIQKMIRNCLKQYDSDAETLPIASPEMEKLCRQIAEQIAADPEVELFEVINDAVYEFLTE